MKQKSETFCVKPWIHMATYTSGEALMCCVAKEAAGNLNRDTIKQIWNSKHYRKARLAMLAGDKVSACTKCYSEENAGVPSHRVIENHVWMEKRTTNSQPHVGENYINDLINKTEKDGFLRTPPISFDFRLGNTCNLQCVMCGPKDSSKWVNFAKELGQDMSKWDTSKFNWVENEDFWNKQFLPLLPGIKHLILAGGEPLLLKQHVQLLEKCVATDHSKHIKIRYHTNGTIVPDHVVKLWEQFEAIDFCVSLDCWGEKNSYIRYPDMWRDILDNLHIIDNSSDNVSPRLNCTVNAINVFYLPEYCDWVIEQNFKKINKHEAESTNIVPFIGYVHGPTHLNCKVLPKNVKAIIADKYKEWYEKFDRKWFGLERVYSVKDFMLSEDKSRHYPEFKNYIKQIDYVRGTNFEKTFPDYWEVLREGQ